MKIADSRKTVSTADRRTMNLRLFLVWVPLVLWTCATPAPPGVPPLLPTVPDDDHRLVSREAFHASGWAPLGAAVSWKSEAAGISATLADGRVLRLEFPAPSVVRWWVPAGPGDRPFSPGAVYPPSPPPLFKVKETDGVLFVDTPTLGVRLRLADLSWTLVRGEKTVLTTLGGPQAAGRRLVQRFDARNQLRWGGPGLTRTSPSAKFWVNAEENPDGGPFAAPALFGSGASFPVSLILDSSYQSYSRIGAEEVSLGALNGGLDLLISTGPRPAALVEALSALTGRPAQPPQWAHGTALVLPPAETGTFVRQAKLSIQTAIGSGLNPRQRFESLVSGSSGEGPPPGAGVFLTALPARSDWDTPFDEKGASAPLARMNNQRPSLEAQAALEAWKTRTPGLRPLILAASGSWGTIRHALPEVTVKAGQEGDALVRVLSLSASGLGTPAIRLDLAALAHPESRPAAYQSLLTWLLAPVLILEWGSDPAGFWSALPEPDRKRLKTILDLRSQFKPLLIQNARQAAQTGRPSWQPLWFAAPQDPQALARDDQFLVGDNLLSAPLSGGTASRSVYLPGPGIWFDFWSGEEFGGGRAYTLEGRPDRPLLFVRGGSLLPVREPETFDGKDVYNPLTVHVFPGGRSSGTYTLDDGRTVSRQGSSWEVRLVYDFSQKEMTIDHEPVATADTLKPDPYLLYRVHNVFKPKQVKIDGKAIPLHGDSWGITDSDRSAAWYEGDHTLLLKTFRPEKAQSIVMSF